MEETRAKVATLINATEPREIVFTHVATEALNLLAMAFSHVLLRVGTAR